MSTLPPEKLERSEIIEKQNGYFQNLAIKFQLCCYAYYNFDQTHYLHLFLGAKSDFNSSELKNRKLPNKMAPFKNRL